MKSILIYSGKGGVGKTTIAYSLAKAAHENGKKVIVLDMDLNTPSMHLFKNEPFEIISNGKNSSIYIAKSIINLFIKDAIKKIRDGNPDLLFIDTPPSITDIHISIIEKLNISSVILVSQPSKLSKSDVERTIPFWLNRNINILGVIENMVRTETLDYTFPKLCKIPLEDTLDSEIVYFNNKKIFKKIIPILLSKKVIDTNQEIKKRIIFNEDIEWEDIERMYGISHSDKDGDDKFYNLSDLKFINLKTWPKLREAHMHFNIFKKKDAYTESTPETVTRLVEAFREDDVAAFILVRSVTLSTSNTGEVTLFPGEIGNCTLYQSEKLGNIPMVSYNTNLGPVNLFSYEVKPAEKIDIEDAISNGGTYSKDGRLIPSEEVLKEIYNYFGDRIGMKSNYAEIRKKILK